MNTKIQKSNIKVSEHEFLWSTFVKTSVDAFDDDRSDLNRIRNDEKKNRERFSGSRDRLKPEHFFRKSVDATWDVFFQEYEAS